MNKKQIIAYSSIIAALVITLSVLWAPIITTVNTGDNVANDPNQSMGANTSTVTYSATKTITENETITTGEFTSTNADENAILATGGITANLSNIIVTKTGDSDGGDNASFYGTNSAILAKDGENSGEVSLVLDETSTLTLTGDTYLKSLTNADASNSDIKLNGYKLYIDGVEL